MGNKYGANQYNNIFSRGFNGFNDIFAELSRETTLLSNLSILSKEIKDEKAIYSVLAYGLEKKDFDIFVNTYNVYFDIIIKTKTHNDLTIRVSNDYNEKEISVELDKGILKVSINANKENTRRLEIR
jgi:HSP20 family molecular chaperone IbpA